MLQSQMQGVEDPDARAGNAGEPRCWLAGDEVLDVVPVAQPESELTPYGRELEPVVLTLGAWGFKAMGDPREGRSSPPTR